MPRINAPTVEEHHARQRRAILDAARRLLVETGDLPSMSPLGQSVGLARSSVHHYFASKEDLLQALIDDVFPEWIEQVRSLVVASSAPGSQVWAYVELNFALFDSPEYAVAQKLGELADPEAFYPAMREFHLQLQLPLRQALRDLGEPEPEEMAAIIDALILQSTHPSDDIDTETREDLRSKGLLRLQRLFAGYLNLPPNAS